MVGIMTVIVSASVYALGGGRRKTHTRTATITLPMGKRPSPAPGHTCASLPGGHMGNNGTKWPWLQLCYTQRWFLSLRSPAQGPQDRRLQPIKTCGLRRSSDLYSFHTTWLCCRSYCRAAWVGVAPCRDLGVAGPEPAPSLLHYTTIKRKV